MADLLVLTPHAHQRESLLGFLLRASEENGYPSPSLILSCADLTPDERRRCHVPLEKIAPVFNRDPAAFGEIAWKPSTPDGHKSATLRGHTLLARSLCLQHPKVCPDCIVESGIVDACWDIAFMVGCPKHNRPLVWRCPDCAQRLRWNRQGLLTCTCGASLCAAADGVLPPRLWDLLEYLQRRFYAEDTRSLYPTRRMPLYEFEKMSLQGLVTLVEILGKVASGHTGKTRNHGNAVDPDWYFRVASAGAQTLSDWPKNFYFLLNGLIAHTEAAERTVIQLYELLFKNTDVSHEFVFVRGAIDEYMNRRPDRLRPRLMRSKHIPRKDQNFLSLRQYSLVTGTDVRALRGAINKGLIKASKTSGSGTVRYRIDVRDAPPNLAKQTGETYSRRDAALYLGLSENTVCKIRDLGSLKPKHVPVPPTCYRIEDLQEFKAKMLALAKLIHPEDYDSGIHIKLSEVKGHWRAAWTSKAEVIHAVYTQALVPIGRLSDSLQDIVLPKPES